MCSWTPHPNSLASTSNDEFHDVSKLQYQYRSNYNTARTTFDSYFRYLHTITYNMSTQPPITASPNHTLYLSTTPMSSFIEFPTSNYLLVTQTDLLSPAATKMHNLCSKKMADELVDLLIQEEVVAWLEARRSEEAQNIEMGIDGNERSAVE
jgi:hypothetical protein